MERSSWLLLAALPLLAAAGCRTMTRPNWFHPGAAEYQQARAHQFDPYPEKGSGPAIVQRKQVTDELLSNIVCLIPTDQNRTRIEFVHDELLKRGIHCAAIKRTPQGLIDQIRIPPLLRFCFHYWNTAEEVDFTIKTLSEIAEHS